MNKLTEEHCKFVAMTCKTTKEFWNKHRSVAMKAAKMGWYDSYTWLARGNGFLCQQAIGYTTAPMFSLAMSTQSVAEK